MNQRIIHLHSTIPRAKNLNPRTAHTPRLRAACLTAVALLLAPGLRAQSDAPKPAPAAIQNVDPTKLTDRVTLTLDKELAVHFLEQDGAISQPTVVEKPEDPMRTAIFDLKVFPNYDVPAIRTKNPFSKTLRYRALARLKGRKDFIEISRAPVAPGKTVTQTVDATVEEVILFDLKLVAERGGVRQKFVPVPADPSRGNRSDFSRLHHFENDYPDVLMLMAHAGVGDSFPVQEEGLPEEFEVKVTAGNDDKLELEISWDEVANSKLFQAGKSPMKRTLSRDSTLTLPQTGEFQYVISYPSVTVASDDKNTTDKAMFIVNRWPAFNAYATTTEGGAQLFSMRFQGASVARLQATLQRAFPKDNVVMSAAAARVELPPFEIHNVWLNELARTIEFLSEGRLSVEVVEKDVMSNHIWRIAAKNSPAAAAPVKMRSVAAPHLFADEKRLDHVQKDAEDMEKMRLEIVEDGRMGLQGVDPMTQRVITTQIKRLTNQKAFVVIGSEDGVAGLESFIKAAEQRATEEAAAQASSAAAAAPKMRAVYAPHIFRKDARLKNFMEEAMTAEQEWEKLSVLQAPDEASARQAVSGRVRIEPRLGNGGIFVLFGSEQGIANMESMIKSREQLSADEDANDEKRLAEDKARNDEARKAAEERQKPK